MKNCDKTQDLPGLPTPKKRGRPPTGQAQTGAERKRRQRRMAYINEAGEASQTTLLEVYAWSIKEAATQRTAINAARELLRRAEAAYSASRALIPSLPKPG